MQGIPSKVEVRNHKITTTNINHADQRLNVWFKFQHWTSFLMDLLKSMSFGSIMRSLNALRRWKDLNDVSSLSSLLAWLFTSSSGSSSSIPNKSVSHLDQFPIWDSQNTNGEKCGLGQQELYSLRT
jgi:hypothetical protein